MFTGLIEHVGRVEERRPLDGGARFRIAAPFSGELEEGESVSVDGACLSVVEAGGGTFSVEATRVTLGRTTLGGWTAGRRVNLERALRTGDRLGGHMVQGHVDAVGEVEAVEPAGETVLVRIRLPADVGRVTVPRGSLAVDGVSLTVAELDDAVAEVALIPHTREHTALDRLSAGEGVNLEADLVGKYVERLMRPYVPEIPDGSASGTDKRRRS